MIRDIEDIEDFKKWLQTKDARAARLEKEKKEKLERALIQPKHMMDASEHYKGLPKICLLAGLVHFHRSGQRRTIG